MKMMVSGVFFVENDGLGGLGGPLGGVLGPSGSKGAKKLVRGTPRGSKSEVEIH